MQNEIEMKKKPRPKLQLELQLEQQEAATLSDTCQCETCVAHRAAKKKVKK